MKKLPEGWKYETFEQLKIQIIDGDRGNNYPKQNEFTKEGFCLFLSAKNVTKRGFEFNEKQFITKEKDLLLRKGKLSKGDLVLTTRGTVGNIAYYNNSVEYKHLRINSGMVLLRSPENIDNLYFYKIMTSYIVQNNIKNIAFGSAQPQLTVKEIKKFKIPLPPLEEQKKIAEILSTVDQKIAFVDNQIEETELLKKGLMQKLLTEGIGHSEFKDSEVGRIPESWEVIQIKQLGSVITGSTPKTSHKEYYNHGTRLWASPSDLGKSKEIKNTATKLSELGFKQTRILPTRSILVTCIGSTIGKIGIAYEEMSTNQQINSVVCNEKNDPDFYYYALEQKKEYIKKLAGTQAVPLLNKTDFSMIKVIHPPLEEQKKIAEILSTTDEKLENLKAKKESFEELKKGLMQKLLTGEVRV